MPTDTKITMTVPAMPMRRYRYVRCRDVDASALAMGGNYRRAGSGVKPSARASSVRREHSCREQHDEEPAEQQPVDDERQEAVPLDIRHEECDDGEPDAEGH